MKNKYVLYTALTLLFSSVSYADSYGDSFSHSHSYIGLGLGSTNSNARTRNLTSPNVCNVVGSNCHLDNQDKSWQIQGGYKVSPFMAVEGAYVDLGRTADITDGTLRGTQDTKGISLAAVGKVPLGAASLYGKAGIFHWDSSAQIGTNKTDSSGTDPVLGVGLEYEMSNKWTTRLGWDRYYNIGDKHSMLDSAGPHTLKADVDVYTIGVYYKF